MRPRRNHRHALQPPPQQEPNEQPESREAAANGFRRVLPRWLNRNLACLFLGRGLRASVMTFMGIIIPIYLAQIGYGARSLGVIITVSAVASALLVIAVGVMADRIGRKPFMIILALMIGTGAVALTLSTAFAVLLFAASMGTISRGGGAGGGGAWGPYYPAEQPLIAEQVDALHRTTVFGSLAFVGVSFSAVGSLMAALPELFHHHLGIPLIEAYHIMFGVVACITVLIAIVMIPVREMHRPRSSVSARRPEETAAQPATSSRALPMGLSKDTWSLAGRFMCTSLINGLAVGMLGPFMVYWFFRRYGATATQLGELFFVVNLITAIPYLTAGRLALRLGVVRTVVTMRASGAVMLFCMALMPQFWMAAMVYAVRMVFNVLAIPVRQSYVMGIIPEHERARVAGLSSFPLQAGASCGPYLAGYLMAQVAISLPLELASVLQFLNAFLYHLFFHKVLPPEEVAAAEE